MGVFINLVFQMIPGINKLTIIKVTSDFAYFLILFLMIAYNLFFNNKEDAHVEIAFGLINCSIRFSWILNFRFY